MPIGHVAPELALTIGAVAVVLLSLVLPRKRQGLCAPLTLAVLAAAAAFAVDLHVSAARTLTFSGTWALDELTAWSTYVILATAGFVTLLSPRWFASDPRHGEWYAILLFSTLGAIVLAGAADLSELMVGMLLTSATGYTLASYHRAHRGSAEAGAKLYFLGALANPILFLGIILLYGVAGTTGYAGITETLARSEVQSLPVAAGVALVLVGLAFELGAFPVHPWVPDVAQASPAPAAAFLTVAPKVGALAAVARVGSLLPDATLAWRPGLAVIAALTMTLGNLAALWQDDVRRLLGWSSVSQAGYGLMAVVALGRSSLALPSLVLFAIGYALANVTAFAVVVSLRGRTDRRDYRGLGKTRPLHAIAMTLALLSLIGIPPLIGFTAKLALFGAAIESGYAVLAGVAVVNTVVSVFYYLRVIAPMFLASGPSRVPLLGWEARSAFVVSALLVVATGLATHIVASPLSGGTVLPR